MQTFDPDDLVRDVVVLLQLLGLEAQVKSRKDAVVGASMLLRALGVTPAVGDEKALARAADTTWGDRDD